MHSIRLSRRRLLQARAAGVAAASFATGWRTAGGAAHAAGPSDPLRRSAWLTAADGEVALVADPGRSLRLAAVADLPVAARIPALRGHDDAFILRFAGPAGLEPAIHRLRHPQLGDIALFLAPADGDATGLYEAVIDRTVRIPGLDGRERASAAPADATTPPAAAPAAAAPPTGATAASPTATGPADAGRPRRRPARRAPRLRRVELRRGPAGRVALADLALADADRVVAVHGALLRDGRVVGRASARLRSSGRRARLRLAGRRRLARGRHVLALTLVDRDGRVTRIRRAVRVR